LITLMHMLLLFGYKLFLLFFFDIQFNFSKHQQLNELWKSRKFRSVKALKFQQTNQANHQQTKENLSTQIVDSAEVEKIRCLWT
jgi:hypothetical protein